MTTADDNLTMEQTAPYAGLSYERFRKVWPDLVAREQMPSPVHGLIWDRAAMAAWRTHRSQRATAPRRAAEGSVADLTPAATLPDPRRAQRAKAQFEDFRRA